jgi:hypothetical protein
VHLVSPDAGLQEMHFPALNVGLTLTGFEPETSESAARPRPKIFEQNNYVCVKKLRAFKSLSSLSEVFMEGSDVLGPARPRRLPDPNGGREVGGENSRGGRGRSRSSQEQYFTMSSTGTSNLAIWVCPSLTSEMVRH